MTFPDSEVDAQLIAALVLAPSASAHEVYAAEASRAARREIRAALFRALTNPIVRWIRSRRLTFDEFFSSLFSAVITWFIGCCIAAGLLYAANGFRSLEETAWATPLLAVIYTVLAVLVLFPTFTEPRN